MKEPIILVENLIRNYGNGDAQVQVLRGISFRIEPGEFVIIFGPSGSGKSTLLSILSGLEDATSGTVRIDGQDVAKLDSLARAQFHREKIGMVFQAYNLIPSLNILQNITLPLVFSKQSKKMRNAKAKRLLADFKLSHIANRLPTEISGGQAQRVGIIRALVIEPPIIIADEPTGNLDSVATKNVMDLFAQLNRDKHYTLVVVTHDPSLFVYADRIIHVLDGTIIKETVRKHKMHQELPAGPSAFDLLYHKETDPERKKMFDIIVMMLNHHQIAALHHDELLKIVELMRMRLHNHISEHQFFEALDLPQKKGGVGLYKPTAHHIAEHFEHILAILT